jgi:hypothetical protein
MKQNRITTEMVAAPSAATEYQTDDVQYSELQTSPKLAFVIVALAGLALASGCSSTSHETSASNSPPPATAYAEPAPAVGASVTTPGGQSSGTATSSTTVTTTEAAWGEVITDPRSLPPGGAAAYAGSSVYFTHMTVRKVYDGNLVEVTSDDGGRFYILVDYSAQFKPGDVVVITGILREPASYTTAFVKKDSYALMQHPYYIEVQKIEMARQ